MRRAGGASSSASGRLKRFFSPQLAELIVAGGADDPLRTHRREVTVVFLDLRGFTAFAETAEPEEVMGVLREYHAEMGRLILAHEGTLERFTGDGMMIFFNDPVPVPNPAERAIRMARRHARPGRASSPRGWRKRGWDLALGVGIAQGYATIGAIGFEGRWDYGAIGTVTNLAARLCGEAGPMRDLSCPGEWPGPWRISRRSRPWSLLTSTALRVWCRALPRAGARRPDRSRSRAAMRIVAHVDMDAFYAFGRGGAITLSCAGVPSSSARTRRGNRTRGRDRRELRGAGSTGSARPCADLAAWRLAKPREERERAGSVFVRGDRALYLEVCGPGSWPSSCPRVSTRSRGRASTRRTWILSSWVTWAGPGPRPERSSGRSSRARRR